MLARRERRRRRVRAARRQAGRGARARRWRSRRARPSSCRSRGRARRRRSGSAWAGATWWARSGPYTPGARIASTPHVARALPVRRRCAGRSPAARGSEPHREDLPDPAADVERPRALEALALVPGHERRRARPAVDAQHGGARARAPPAPRRRRAGRRCRGRRAPARSRAPRRSTPARRSASTCGGWTPRTSAPSGVASESSTAGRPRAHVVRPRAALRPTAHGPTGRRCEEPRDGTDEGRRRRSRGGRRRSSRRRTVSSGAARDARARGPGLGQALRRHCRAARGRPDVARGRARRAARDPTARASRRWSRAPPGSCARPAGTVRVCGAAAGTPPARRALGYLAELFRFPGWASADELLRLHQRLSGSTGGAAERAELLGLVGLGDEGGRRVEAMSKGMQQRLGIAQALVGGPRLLLLDEPTSALDPVGRRIVRDLLAELRRRGVAVLLNTHLLSEVERVCDRVAIIDHGELLAEGRPDELVAPARRRGRDRRPARSASRAPPATRCRRSSSAWSPRASASTRSASCARRSRTPIWPSWSPTGRERRPRRRRPRPARVAAPARVRGRRRAHARLRRPLHVGRERAVQGRQRLRRQRVRPRRADAGGRHPARAWRCSARSSSAPCWPSSSRSSAVRGDAETGLLQPLIVRPLGRRQYLAGRFLAAAAVAFTYVGVVYAGAVVITGITGDWWPESPVGAGLRLALASRRRGGAVAAGLDLPHRDRQRDRRAHDLRRGPARRPAGLDRRRAELEHPADDRQHRLVGAALRGPLPRRAAPARRRTSRASPARSSSSARSAARTTPASLLLPWIVVYLCPRRAPGRVRLRPPGSVVVRVACAALRGVQPHHRGKGRAGACPATPEARYTATNPTMDGRRAPTRQGRRPRPDRRSLPSLDDAVGREAPRTPQRQRRRRGRHEADR